MCLCLKALLMLLTSIHRGEYKTSKVVKENTNSISNNTEMISSDEDDGYLTRCLEEKNATDMRLATVAMGTSGHGGLGKLSIKGRSSSSAIACGCPSLKALSLWNVLRVGDEIAKECYSLKRLDLCQCPSVLNKS